MSAMALIGFSGNGLGLPAIVLFPVAPLLAILLADLMAAIFISVSSVLLIIIFIYLEISGYPFSPSPLPENMENIMRGSWLIFSIILITMIGWYYRVKVDALLLKLQSQADTDHLTEIANRRSLEDSLHREFYRIKRSGGWLSLLLIDIDNFKKVNDKDGHLKGDECLVSIAKQIKYHCKRAIDVVGRYGGDEFMVVLPDTAPNEAEDISEKIRVSIESLNFDIADDIKISATIGCFSIIDPEDMDTQAVIERVDQLLYEGKSVGRNIVITGIEEGGLD
jgi:diguanylate cyclase (GGDEF)-like protein